MTRVLIIKTSSLGDVIHTFPALTDAKAAIPGIKFDWVVEEGFSEIPEWHPAVDYVIPVALRRWRKNIVKTFRGEEWQDFKNLIGERQYDLVIDAQGLIKSSFLTRYARGHVVGLDDKSAREPLSRFFYDEAYAVPKAQHAVERVRQLFSQALNYKYPVHVGDYGLDVDSIISTSSAATSVGKKKEKYFVFLHGTTWESKLWPENYWKQLAKAIIAKGAKVKIAWGNEDEQARAHRIQGTIEGVEILPKMNLMELAGELAGATAAVSVDTGLGHLTAALNVPVVSVYGATDSRLTGIYGNTQKVIQSDYECSPCLRRICKFKKAAEYQSSAAVPPCFVAIKTDIVLVQLTELLKKNEAEKSA